MGTYWPAVLRTDVGAHMVCIWSLQTCYMHACIKSAYMRVNLSGHAPSHASWTHAYWHGHTLACSVVYRVMHTCVHQPLYIWSLQICYMDACIKSAYLRVNFSGQTHIRRFDARVHVASLQ